MAQIGGLENVRGRILIGLAVALAGSAAQAEQHAVTVSGNARFHESLSGHLVNASAEEVRLRSPLASGPDAAIARGGEAAGSVVVQSDQYQWHKLLLDNPSGETLPLTIFNPLPIYSLVVISGTGDGNVGKSGYGEIDLFRDPEHYFAFVPFDAPPGRSHVYICAVGSHVVLFTAALTCHDDKTPLDRCRQAFYESAGFRMRHERFSPKCCPIVFHSLYGELCIINFSYEGSCLLSPAYLGKGISFAIDLTPLCDNARIEAINPVTVEVAWGAPHENNLFVLGVALKNLDDKKKALILDAIMALARQDSGGKLPEVLAVS
jgi:hypothetical protein